MEAIEPRDGACRCGRVRLRISGPVLMTMACHCTGCQRMTAAPYSLSTLVAADDFSVIEGDTVTGGLHGTPTHKFCAYCMSWLYTEIPTGFVNVRSTMLDDTREIAPFIETMTREGLPFAATGATRSFEGFPSEAEFPGLMEAFATARG